MLWLLIPLSLFFRVAVIIRQQRRAGTWMWNVFFAALAICAADTIVLVLPLDWAMDHRQYLLPAVLIGVTAALALLVGFILAVRRIQLPAAKQEQPTAPNQAV